jgi:hypothetical protein
MDMDKALEGAGTREAEKDELHTRTNFMFTLYVQLSN